VGKPGIVPGHDDIAVKSNLAKNQDSISISLRKQIIFMLRGMADFIELYFHV
jgi:hypothetical protein